jgi:hypothetical protein
MSAPGNSQRKWPSNDETHNKPPITSALGIIVQYVSWKKRSGIVVMFLFFSSNVTANNGSFWCLMTEIQKLRSSCQVFIEASFEVSSKFLRSFFEVSSKFLRSSSKLPWKNKKLRSFLRKSSFFLKKKSKISFKLSENLLFFSKMRNFPDSHCRNYKALASIFILY